MDNDELLKINAKITFDEILANQKDLEEFNKLGSKNEEVRDFILTVMPFGFLILANIFFTIDTELFQVLCIIFFASLRLLFKAWLQLKVRKLIVE
jgi:hypothetical protein